jgi:hypothetical protein
VTQPTGLDATLHRLDRIIEDSCTERSHLGVFPAMYRTVTAAVRDAVRTGGFFDDDERIEHLTVVFAGRYFEAYDRYRSREEAARCWAVAFETAESPHRRMILQHLLLGMNAHINLDLGLATFSAAGKDLPAVRADFIRVNEILFQILDRLQGRLGEVSPRMSLLDRLGGAWDERVMRVGIRTCRDLAWDFAGKLAESPDASVETAARDEDAVWLANSMLKPWSPVGLAARVVSRVESRDIPAIVDALSRVEVDLDEAERATEVDLAADPSQPATLRDVAGRRRRRLR